LSDFSAGLHEAAGEEGGIRVETSGLAERRDLFSMPPEETERPRLK